MPDSTLRPPIKLAASLICGTAEYSLTMDYCASVSLAINPVPNEVALCSPH
jgi:hypothetical protein